MKILVAPSSFGACGSEPLDLLRGSGLQVVVNPFHRRLTADEVISLGQDCAGIIAGVEPLTAEVISRLPALRCISRCGVGMENVDLKAAAAHGVAVRSTPEAPTRAVAELALGLTLALLRRIPLADRNVRRNLWVKEIGNLLLGKTVGIVGLGRIGRSVAELCLCMGCTVRGTDPYPDRDWLSRHSVSLLPLKDLLRESDIVSLHLTFETGRKPLIGEQELAAMKESAFLLNLSRGDVIDEAALCRALNERRIAGAALDVFASEPYTGPLTALDNVVLTPHLGSYALEARVHMEVLSVKNLLEVLNHPIPSNDVALQKLC